MRKCLQIGKMFAHLNKKIKTQKNMIFFISKSNKTRYRKPKKEKMTGRFPKPVGTLPKTGTSFSATTALDGPAHFDRLHAPCTVQPKKKKVKLAEPKIERGCAPGCENTCNRLFRRQIGFGLLMLTRMCFLKIKRRWATQRYHY